MKSMGLRSVILPGIVAAVALTGCGGSSSKASTGGTTSGQTSTAATTAAPSPSPGIAEAAAASGWSIQQTPNPAGAKRSALYGVSCPSTSACAAVGDYINSASIDVTLAEGWDGSSWAIQQTPGFAAGVSCASTTACTAVGTLTERWDGTSWAIQQTPNPPDATYSPVLVGVSCASTIACIAVGNYENSAGTDVMLAERWNGTSWSIQRTPNPTGAKGSYLTGVSCASTTACTAVGYFGAANIEVPQSPGLRPVAERWNGTSWSIQRTPNPAGATSSQLDGVSCASKTACTAVGSYINSFGTAVTLAERWNGTSWSIQRTRNPAGPWSRELNVLVGVSCASTTACTAVGKYENASGTPMPLAERWNGTSWAIQRTPNPAAGRTFWYILLSGVSCASTTVCTAVGFTDVGMVAERYS
jgi:hypothetical protein